MSSEFINSAVQLGLGTLFNKLPIIMCCFLTLNCLSHLLSLLQNTVRTVEVFSKFQNCTILIVSLRLVYYLRELEVKHKTLGLM